MTGRDRCLGALNAGADMTTIVRLSTGILDAVKQMREDPGMFEVVITSDDNFMIAGAVRTGDSIRDVFNEGLNSMKEDGTLRRLYGWAD